MTEDSDLTLENSIRRQARNALPKLVDGLISDLSAPDMPRNFAAKKGGIQLLAQIAFNTGSIKSDAEQAESGSAKADLKKAVQEAMAQDPEVRAAVIRGKFGKAVGQ